MLKNCSCGVPYKSVLAPAIKFVIVMAQRPSFDIPVLRVRAKFTRILLDSVKC